MPSLKINNILRKVRQVVSKDKSNLLKSLKIERETNPEFTKILKFQDWPYAGESYYGINRQIQNMCKSEEEPTFLLCYPKSIYELCVKNNWLLIEKDYCFRIPISKGATLWRSNNFLKDYKNYLDIDQSYKKVSLYYIITPYNSADLEEDGSLQVVIFDCGLCSIRVGEHNEKDTVGYELLDYFINKICYEAITGYTRDIYLITFKIFDRLNINKNYIVYFLTGLVILPTVVLSSGAVVYLEYIPLLQGNAVLHNLFTFIILYYIGVLLPIKILLNTLVLGTHNTEHSSRNYKKESKESLYCFRDFFKNKGLKNL